MLVKLTPEQIGENWALLRPMIVETLPMSLRIQADAMENILRALLAEEAQFWAYYRKEEDGQPRAITVTTVVVDKVAGAPYLLIYSMFALEALTKEDYILGLDTLRSYAGSRGCKEVLAYVEDDRMIRTLQQVGGQKVTNIMRL